MYLGIGFGPKALESSQAKDSFYFITFDGSCIRLCRSWSCPFASSPFYGNTLVIIKSNLKCSRAVLKIICGISHASLWAIFVIVICVQAASSSVRGLQLGWQQMPCRQPHATKELGWGQHGSSATERWVLGLDKATTNNSHPIYCLKSSQTCLPILLLFTVGSWQGSAKDAPHHGHWVLSSSVQHGRVTHFCSGLKAEPAAQSQPADRCFFPKNQTAGIREYFAV